MIINTLEHLVASAQQFSSDNPLPFDNIGRIQSEKVNEYIIREKSKKRFTIKRTRRGEEVDSCRLYYEDKPIEKLEISASDDSTVLNVNLPGFYGDKISDREQEHRSFFIREGSSISTLHTSFEPEDLEYQVNSIHAVYQPPVSGSLGEPVEIKEFGFRKRLLPRQFPGLRQFRAFNIFSEGTPLPQTLDEEPIGYILELKYEKAQPFTLYLPAAPRK